MEKRAGRRQYCPGRLCAYCARRERGDCGEEIWPCSREGCGEEAGDEVKHCWKFTLAKGKKGGR